MSAIDGGASVGGAATAAGAPVQRWRYDVNEVYAEWRIRAAPSLDATELATISQGETFDVVAACGRNGEATVLPPPPAPVDGDDAGGAAPRAAPPAWVKVRYTPRGGGGDGDGGPIVGWSAVVGSLGRQRLFAVAAVAADGSVMEVVPPPPPPPLTGGPSILRAMSDEGVIVPPGSPTTPTRLLRGESAASYGTVPGSDSGGAAAGASEWVTGVGASRVAAARVSSGASDSGDDAVPPPPSAPFDRPTLDVRARRAAQWLARVPEAAAAAAPSDAKADDDDVDLTTVPAALEAMQRAPGAGTFLSELTFYLRFYAAAGKTYDGDVLALTDDIRGMVGGYVEPGAGGAAESPSDVAWRFICRSRLGEFTACGHFADTYLSTVYFASGTEARAAAAVSVSRHISTPAALIEHLDADPDASIVIRVERSCFDATKWAAYKRGTGPCPSAYDIGHVYMIDIPPAPPAARAGARRVRTDAFFVQSALSTYDASVAKIPYETMQYHLRFIADCDGSSGPMSSALFLHQISLANFSVPTTLGPGTDVMPAWEPEVPLSDSQVRRLRRGAASDGDVVQPVFGVFQVHEYDSSAVLRRLRGHVADAFSAEALATKVPYNAGRVEWCRVLDIVWGWNAASANPLVRQKSVGDMLEPVDGPAGRERDDGGAARAGHGGRGGGGTGRGGGGAAGASGASGDGYAACSACTFLNRRGVARCDMCGTEMTL